jgi:hypothetical protein
MSILKVDTINEKTSGNGVEIAHALKGSGIAGHVIQAVTATFSGASTNSSSYVALTTCGSITTTVANSKLLVTAAAQMQLLLIQKPHMLCVLLLIATHQTYTLKLLLTTEKAIRGGNNKVCLFIHYIVQAHRQEQRLRIKYTPKKALVHNLYILLMLGV